MSISPCLRGKIEIIHQIIGKNVIVKHVEECKEARTEYILLNCI
jgi:hypothetical protein